MLNSHIHICSNIRWLVEKILSKKSIPASTSAASHYLVSAPRPTWKKDIVTTDDQNFDDDDDKDILKSVDILSIKAPLQNLAMVVIVKPNLVTSPSFLSTARALLSIHCRESMCAFNTCKRVVKLHLFDFDSSCSLYSRTQLIPLL